MKIIEHSYMNKPESDYMDSLSKQLGTEVIENHIEIPEKFGSGIIKSLKIDDVLSLRCYHFVLKHDLVFKWIIDEEIEANFKLVFFLDQYEDDPKNTVPSALKLVVQNKAVLFSTDLVRSGLVLKNTLVKRLVFLFSKNWLHLNFNEASDKIRGIVNHLAKTNQPTFIVEEMPESHYNLVHELIREMTSQNSRLIQTKSKGLILINDFLDKIVCKNASIEHVYKTNYYPQMMRAERILSEQFDKPIPNINELAQQCHLSTTTLKRHFKIVFGKSIYTYCLEKKLGLGKSMLIAKSKSVSEIAFDLGYDKVNSFSKAFKKQYGILPRDVNKTKSNVLFFK